MSSWEGLLILRAAGRVLPREEDLPSLVIGVSHVSPLHLQSPATGPLQSSRSPLQLAHPCLPHSYLSQRRFSLCTRAPHSIVCTHPHLLTRSNDITADSPSQKPSTLISTSTHTLSTQTSNVHPMPSYPPLFPTLAVSWTLPSTWAQMWVPVNFFPLSRSMPCSTQRVL